MGQGDTAAFGGEEHIYLVGHTPFQQYLDYMASEPVDAQSQDMRHVADEWRAANAHMQELQATEAGYADNAPVTPVPAAFAHLVEKVHADPIFQRSFAYVPAELGVVELDRLVVRQKTINLAHVQRVKDRLGANLNAEAVFRACLPFDHPTASHKSGYVADDTYVFVSPSNDIRFLESVVLRPDQITGYHSFGPIAGVVALIVGFGSNYLNAIAAEGRLVLNNGSHRAFALRDMGITHVPCVIQRVGSREELEVVAAGALRRDPDLFLRDPRPPVLKDYFDPRLRRVVRVDRSVRNVRVHYSVETFDVPDAG